MTDLARSCDCRVCWCLEPTVDDVCEACARGEHQPAPSLRATPAAPRPRCSRHRWDLTADPVACMRCGRPRDPDRARRGRGNKKRGGRHELDVARKYGGVKVGHHNGPVDVLLGELFNVQLKTHHGAPPLRLMRLLEAMDVSAGGRLSVVVDRYLQPGRPAVDVFHIRGADWLALHGKDGVE